MPSPSGSLLDRLPQALTGVARRARVRAAPDPRLGALKLAAINVAFKRLGARSLADLGGVWAVDAGYSLYALDRYSADRVVVVDDDFTPVVEERAALTPELDLVRADFGSAEAAEAVGRVDAILLFDVLVHQARPDWDEVIDLYAQRADIFVIVNPQWVRSPATVRLTDMSREDYLAVVPEQSNHRLLHDRLDETNERRGKLWRDVHDVWQWGITDGDMRARLAQHGFRLAHFENHGTWWRGLPYDYCSYVGARPERFNAVPSG